MVKLSNKISYTSIFVILFVLIAIFFIVRNVYLLSNSIPVDATCYRYEKESDKYNISYFFEYDNTTFYINELVKNKPKLSSKKQFFCNKNNIKQCVTDKKIYKRDIFLSLFALIPIIFLITIYIIKRLKKSMYQK